MLRYVPPIYHDPEHCRTQTWNPQVMRFAAQNPNANETALVAHFEYLTSLNGSPRAAYVPVCASGSSALTIHYTDNNLPIHSGDLILLDAGCEFAGYSSDITRTWPVSGRFSAPQLDIYSAVLLVEKECIKLCTLESNMSLDDLHNKSCELMRIELNNLGFNLNGGVMERTLYPHFLGHPLGIDLHDTGSFGRNEKLRAGMVIVSLSYLHP
jgi:intermediate cleaving peptidase 55